MSRLTRYPPPAHGDVRRFFSYRSTSAWGTRKLPRIWTNPSSCRPNRRRICFRDVFHRRANWTNERVPARSGSASRRSGFMGTTVKPPEGCLAQIRPAPFFLLLLHFAEVADRFGTAIPRVLENRLQGRQVCMDVANQRHPHRRSASRWAVVTTGGRLFSFRWRDALFAPVPWVASGDCFAPAGPSRCRTAPDSSPCRRTI